jgi:hypothetical protein
MLQFNTAGLEFQTAEQCEQFQMMAFSISCATCERSDQQCPWERRDQLTTAEPRTDHLCARLWRAFRSF